MKKVILIIIPIFILIIFSLPCFASTTASRIKFEDGTTQVYSSTSDGIVFCLVMLQSNFVIYALDSNNDYNTVNFLYGSLSTSHIVFSHPSGSIPFYTDPSNTTNMVVFGGNNGTYAKSPAGNSSSFSDVKFYIVQTLKGLNTYSNCQIVCDTRTPNTTITSSDEIGSLLNVKYKAVFAEGSDQMNMIISYDRYTSTGFDVLGSGHGVQVAVSAPILTSDEGNIGQNTFVKRYISNIGSNTGEYLRATLNWLTGGTFYLYKSWSDAQNESDPETLSLPNDNEIQFYDIMLRPYDYSDDPNIKVGSWSVISGVKAGAIGTSVNQSDSTTTGSTSYTTEVYYNQTYNTNYTSNSYISETITTDYTTYNVVNNYNYISYYDSTTTNNNQVTNITNNTYDNVPLSSITTTTPSVSSGTIVDSGLEINGHTLLNLLPKLLAFIGGFFEFASFFNKIFDWLPIWAVTMLVTSLGIIPVILAFKYIRW